jgi:tetratricopeptide (TPR) repeat protein
VAHLAYWLGFVATVAAGWAAAGLRTAALVGLLWTLVGTFVVIVLPRAAHAAFERGELGAAGWRYRLLARLSPTRARRGAARVSVAACRLSACDVAGGERELGRVAEGALDDAGRAAWLNNRAYARLVGGGDAGVALAQVDEAARLRPDVPGVVHTRGLAQLAAGRTDDAIRSFETMWELGDLAPRLEAERCRDLARAWEAKGHRDYAADYRARAARLWPAAVDAPVASPPVLADDTAE